MRLIETTSLALVLAAATPHLAAQPDPIVLAVTSSPISGVPIEMNGFDMLGRSNGTTVFLRVYNTSSPYSLTAPMIHDDGNLWLFDRWQRRSSLSESFVAQPAGETNISATTGSDDDTVRADYVAGCKISVDVTGPASHTTVGASPADVFGTSAKLAPFSLYYPRSTGTVDLLPPASTTGAFKYWVIDGVQQPLFQVNVSVDVSSSQNITAEAVFGPYIPGGTQAFGSACTGTAGQLEFFVPGNSSTYLGNDFIAAVRNTPQQTNGWISYGLSNTTASGVPLPVQLPGTACDLLIDPLLTVPTVSNPSGIMSHTLPIAPNLQLTGAVFYAQWFVHDPGANALNLTTSEGMEITIAGTSL